MWNELAVSIFRENVKEKLQESRGTYEKLKQMLKDATVKRKKKKWSCKERWWDAD